MRFTIFSLQKRNIYGENSSQESGVFADCLISLSFRESTDQHEESLRALYGMLSRRQGEASGFPYVGDETADEDGAMTGYEAWREDYRLQAGSVIHLGAILCV